MKIFFVKGKRAARFAALGALALALALTLHFTGAWAVFAGGTVRELPIYSVGRDDKHISVTFDCAWGTEHTDAILGALAAENVRATFFMVEFWAEKYPEYVKKIDAAGHEIGTHSATHSQMSKLSEGEIRQELASSSEAIASVIPENELTPEYIIPDSFNPHVKDAVAEAVKAAARKTGVARI